MRNLLLLPVLLLMGCASPKLLEPMKIKGIPGQIMLPVQNDAGDIVFLPLHLYTPAETNKPPASKLSSK